MVYRCAAAFSWKKKKMKKNIYGKLIQEYYVMRLSICDGAATFLFYIPRGKIDETDLLCVWL